jgi:hypothetical protein
MKFYITDNSWNEVKDNVNVDTIRQLFFDAVLPLLNSLDDCEETIITLPEIVTKNERYKIHCMTMDGFYPDSYDKSSYDGQTKRVMFITLSKKYVRGLFNNHEFKRTIPSSKNNIKTEKQLLLESILKFIDNSLKDEFSDYLKTI